MFYFHPFSPQTNRASMKFRSTGRVGLKFSHPFSPLAILFLSLVARASPAAPAKSPAYAHVRLLTSLSSVDSPLGSTFETVVIAPYQVAGRVLIPSGSIISGTVTNRKAVGLGLLNERASLSLQFETYLLPDGRRLPLQARLKHVENGRESVGESGVIQGVLAADSLQQMTAGIWIRPTLTAARRSLVGLTGMSGESGSATRWVPSAPSACSWSAPRSSACRSPISA